jgi:hypothetical protein
MPTRARVPVAIAIAILTIVAATAASIPLSPAQAAAGKKPAPKAFTRGVENECGYAVLLGFVKNHGLPVDFRFQYGHTKRYGHITEKPEESAYDAAQPVEVEEVIDTDPGRLYHYRVVAITEGGKAYGQDRTFRGAPC